MQLLMGMVGKGKIHRQQRVAGIDAAAQQPGSPAIYGQPIMREMPRIAVKQAKRTGGNVTAVVILAKMIRVLEEMHLAGRSWKNPAYHSVAPK